MSSGFDSPEQSLRKKFDWVSSRGQAHSCTQNGTYLYRQHCAYIVWMYSRNILLTKAKKSRVHDPKLEELHKTIKTSILTNSIDLSTKAVLETYATIAQTMLWYVIIIKILTFTFNFQKIYNICCVVFQWSLTCVCSLCSYIDGFQQKIALINNVCTTALTEKLGTQKYIKNYSS